MAISRRKVRASGKTSIYTEEGACSLKKAQAGKAFDMSCPDPLVATKILKAFSKDVPDSWKKAAEERRLEQEKRRKERDARRKKFLARQEKARAKRKSKTR